MRKFVALVCVCSLVAAVGVSPAAAAGGNNSRQVGLVNVSLGDVALLNNVNLAVAADLAATVCGVTVPVAVLATQVIAGSGPFECNTTAGPLTVDQAQNGAPFVGGGGNNSHQTGLVNVSTGDVAILNNVNLAVAANVAATLCGITVPVAVLAVQVLGPTGGFTCDTATGPLSVTQSQ
ncbi:MAG: hypothetical protein ACJ74L_03075 [Gaiellaceae bacterium]